MTETVTVCDFEDNCPCTCGECTVRCDRPSWFTVARSDGDESYHEEPGRWPVACQEHLALTVVALMDGDDSITATVTVRWDQ